MLESVSSIGFDKYNMLTFFGLAFLSLIPTYLTKKEDKMNEEKESKKEKLH